MFDLFSKFWSNSWKTHYTVLYTLVDCPVLTCIVRTPKKKEEWKKPFRAFHRHEEGDGAYVKLGSPSPRSTTLVHTKSSKHCKGDKKTRSLQLSPSLWVVGISGTMLWRFFFRAPFLQFFDALLETLNGIPSCFWWWWWRSVWSTLLKI